MNSLLEEDEDDEEPRESCCIAVSDWHLPGVSALTSPCPGKVSLLFWLLCPEPRPHRGGALAPLSQGQTRVGVGEAQDAIRRNGGGAAKLAGWALSPPLGVAWRCLSTLPKQCPHSRVGAQVYAGPLPQR